MSFQAPLFLIGLVVIPLALLALFAARRRPARYVIRFPAAATLAAVVGRTGRARRVIPPALLCLVAGRSRDRLARPEATVAVPVEKASVMLVTDTSGSMNATDVAPTRLAAAQSAATRFLDRVPEVAADRARRLRRRSPHRAAPDPGPRRDQDHRADAAGQRRHRDRRRAGERARTRSASVSAKSPPAAIVLLSDGASKTGRDPAEVAREAKAAGVPIYTVALGTADGIVQTQGQTLAVPPTPRRWPRSRRSPAAAPSPPRTPTRWTRSTRRSAPGSAPRRRSARSARASPPPACCCSAAPRSPRCAGAGGCRSPRLTVS